MNKSAALCLSVVLSAQLFTGCGKKAKQVDGNETKTSEVGITSFCNYPIKVDGVNYVISVEMGDKCEKNKDVITKILNYEQEIDTPILEETNTTTLEETNTTTLEETNTTTLEEISGQYITSIALKDNVLPDLDLDGCLSFSNKPTGNITIILGEEQKVIFQNGNFLISEEDLSQIAISEIDFIFGKGKMTFQVGLIKHSVTNF